MKRFTVIASFEKPIITEQDKIQRILDIENAEKGKSRKIYNNVDDFISDLRRGL